jgi:hypothetical protein
LLINQFYEKIIIMNWIITVGIITIVAMVLFLSSSFPFNSNLAHGQLPVCPDGSQRSPNGNCELVIPLPDLPRCPNGSQRSPSGFCESTSLTNLQNCPVGYQVSATGFCVPVTNSQFVNPQTALTQPQATFAQPSSSALTSSLVSPSLINPPAGELSPWFPSLPSIACGGSSTMTTIGSIETDSNGDTNDDNDNDRDNDDDDDDQKDYAFQIESDGGPSADPESVDGTVFAGEKNIERNNGKDFDIKDVFNDCQVSMFND